MRADSPPRHLGPDGAAAWRRLPPDADPDTCLLLCESLDERGILRTLVIGNPDDWRSRIALRQLDEQCERLLRAVSVDHSQPNPSLVILDEIRDRRGTGS